MSDKKSKVLQYVVLVVLIGVAMVAWTILEEPAEHRAMRRVMDRMGEIYEISNSQEELVEMRKKISLDECPTEFKEAFEAANNAHATGNPDVIKTAEDRLVEVYLKLSENR